MRNQRLSAAFWAVGLPVVLATGFVWCVSSSGGKVASGRVRELSVAQRARLDTVTVPFIANRGQVDRHVAFYAPTFAGMAFVTRDGEFVLSLPGKIGHAAKEGQTGLPVSAVGAVLIESPVTRTKLDVRGENPGTARISVFRGTDPGRWRANLPTYRTVTIGTPWPGIGYELRAHGDNVERLFKLAPGASSHRIRMRVRGGTPELEHGALVVRTAGGSVAFSKPRACQPTRRGCVNVAVHYTLDGNVYGFRLGKHASSLPVVIDPVIRSTYLGGDGFDVATDALVDPTGGNLYVAGYTQSADFPGTSGAAQPALAGASDAFVAEFDSQLTTLLRATYLGGTGADTGAAIALAPSGSPDAGDVYITGDTQSTDFPGTAGGAQPNCASGCSDTGDAFVSVLTPDLTSLVQSTYLGGSNIDEAHAAAIGPSGTVYVAGRTLSDDFPDTAGGAQPVFQGANYNAFVTAFSPDLTAIDQSTYLGGSSVNGAYALAVEQTSGNVYVGGNTSSTDFPCVSSAGPPPFGGGACGSSDAGAQSAYAGGFDGFVSIFNSALTTLDQSTYFGGTSYEEVRAMAFSPDGDLYIAGQTNSSGLPGISGAAQPEYDGGGDAFVADLNSSVTTLKQATYLGGSGNDYANSIVVASTGEVYVAGGTASSDFPCAAPDGPDPLGGSCPTPHAGAQPYLLGNGDAFVSLLSAGLDQLSQSTYFGGSGSSVGQSVMLAPAAGTAAPNVYVSGPTVSANLPATSGAAQPAYAGSTDGYAAMFSPDLQGPQVDMSVAVDAPTQVQRGTTYTYKIQITNSTAPTSEFDGIATNVVLNDVIPIQATYKSATSSQGQDCTEAAYVVSCDLGDIPANGGSAKVTVKVKVTASGSALNAATINASQAFSTSSTTSVTSITNVPGANTGSNGAASAIGPWTLLGLGLLGLFGAWARRRGGG